MYEKLFFVQNGLVCFGLVRPFGQHSHNLVKVRDNNNVYGTSINGVWFNRNLRQKTFHHLICTLSAV